MTETERQKYVSMRGATTVESTRVVLRSRQSMLAILARASMMQRCVKWGGTTGSGHTAQICLPDVARRWLQSRRPPSIVVVVCPPSTFQTQVGSVFAFDDHRAEHSVRREQTRGWHVRKTAMFYVLGRESSSFSARRRADWPSRTSAVQTGSRSMLLRFCASGQRSGEGRPHGPRTVRDTLRTWAHRGPACSPGAPEGRPWRRWRGGGASPVERGRI